eukprot:3577953-Alexandrium_andersonii.AAC.1
MCPRTVASLARQAAVRVQAELVGRHPGLEQLRGGVLVEPVRALLGDARSRWGPLERQKLRS